MQHTEVETRITLRIPAPLTVKLKSVAKTNRRSLNSEIVHQLSAKNIENGKGD